MKRLELELQKRLLIVDLPHKDCEYGGLLRNRNLYFFTEKMNSDEDYPVCFPLPYDCEFICKGSELTEEIAKGFTDSYYTCFVCGGDGRETCTNPDHGFISALSFHDIGRIGCPVCGHDPQHKIKNGGECECCKGSGKLDSFEFSHEANEYAYDGEGDYNSSLDSFIYAIKSKGYYWGKNPEGEQPHNTGLIDIYPTGDIFMDKSLSEAKEWVAAESKTFNLEKTIIFEIL